MLVGALMTHGTPVSADSSHVFTHGCLSLIQLSLPWNERFSSSMFYIFYPLHASPGHHAHPSVFWAHVLCVCRSLGTPRRPTGRQRWSTCTPTSPSMRSRTSGSELFSLSLSFLSTSHDHITTVLFLIAAHGGWPGDWFSSVFVAMSEIKIQTKQKTNSRGSMIDIGGSLTHTCLVWSFCEGLLCSSSPLRLWAASCTCCVSSSIRSRTEPSCRSSTGNTPSLRTTPSTLCTTTSYVRLPSNLRFDLWASGEELRCYLELTWPGEAAPPGGQITSATFLQTLVLQRN